MNTSPTLAMFRPFFPKLNPYLVDLFRLQLVIKLHGIKKGFQTEAFLRYGISQTNVREHYDLGSF